MGSARIGARYRRARRIYRALGVDDRLLAQERADRVFVFSHWARSINLDWGADPGKTEVVYPGFPTPGPIEHGEEKNSGSCSSGRTSSERAGSRSSRHSPTR